MTESKRLGFKSSLCIHSLLMRYQQATCPLNLNFLFVPDFIKSAEVYLPYGFQKISKQFLAHYVLILVFGYCLSVLFVLIFRH